MSSYQKTLIEALSTSDIERRTMLSGEEAIFKDGKLLASNTKKIIDWENADITERIKPEPELAIFGAGHVAKALYDLAVIQQMKVTIIDEREDICSQDRFPLANRITGKSYNELFKEDFGLFRPYYVIMTHGHKYDNGCLRYALGKKNSYIGMIGSAGKVKATMEDLLSSGYSNEELSKVHSPIGLKIGAVTPEEIAISVMAEIISVFRSEKNLIVLSPEYLDILSKHEGIIVRIIEKKGSAPRAIGTEMLVTKNETFSTIGGGAIELHAIEKARDMLENEKSAFTESLSLSSEGDLKMICGGNVTLLYLRNQTMDI